MLCTFGGVYGFVGFTVFRLALKETACIFFTPFFILFAVASSAAVSLVVKSLNVSATSSAISNILSGVKSPDANISLNSSSFFTAILNHSLSVAETHHPYRHGLSFRWCRCWWFRRCWRGIGVVLYKVVIPISCRLFTVCAGFFGVGRTFVCVEEHTCKVFWTFRRCLKFGITHVVRANRIPQVCCVTQK